MFNLKALVLGCALLLAAADGTSVQHTTGHDLPALPDSIPSQLGWVRVIRTPDLKCGDAPAYGCYTYATRRLEIATGMSRQMEWQALEHERIHMILWDAGFRIDNRGGAEDQLATVIASNRVMERVFAGP